MILQLAVLLCEGCLRAMFGVLKEEGTESVTGGAKYSEWGALLLQQEVCEEVIVICASSRRRGL